MKLTRRALFAVMAGTPLAPHAARMTRFPVRDVTHASAHLGHLGKASVYRWVTASDALVRQHHVVAAKLRELGETLSKLDPPVLP